MKTPLIERSKEKAPYLTPNISVLELSPSDTIATSTAYTPGNMDDGAWQT